MGLLKDAESDKFAENLAVELARRFPPRALGGGAKDSRRDSVIAKAMDHITAAAQPFRRDHKVGLLKRLGVTKAFQAKLDSFGYDEEFIKASTLRLVQALSGK